MCIVRNYYWWFISLLNYCVFEIFSIDLYVLYSLAICFYIFTHFLYVKDHLASHFWFNLKINYFYIVVRQPNISSAAQLHCLFHLGTCLGNLFCTELKNEGFWCHKACLKVHPVSPFSGNSKLWYLWILVLQHPLRILYCGSDDKFYNIWCLNTLRN